MVKQQCEKYWHNQHGRYGNIDVWLEKTEILAHFTLRTFHISSPDCDNPRVSIYLLFKERDEERSSLSFIAMNFLLMCL